MSTFTGRSLFHAHPKSLPVCTLLIAVLLIQKAGAARFLPEGSPLQFHFYDKSCPNVEKIVRQVVSSAVASEARMAGSLLRLHFHDCFSIAGVIEGEQEALPNANSVRGFEVVDAIKAALEQECPGIVSCADILALAARDSVAVSGGPSYPVQLGRRDSLTANRELANKNLPGFNFNVTDLVAAFANVGLSARDMVALSGGHSIGKARCNTFAARLTPDPQDPTALSSSYSSLLHQQCPAGAASDALVDLDVTTLIQFDNAYYSNLLSNRGLLHSDQVLYSTPGATRDLVNLYAQSNSAFAKDFSVAMLKMGSITPPTGSEGQVRNQCGYVNA
ncbi:hypothetical protein KP509_09G044000 [Ceratopteris richardii]|uniref:Peroxidase n=1 Tax=Ceratopteris richardii TaxID=49495 RepID=A0A8T2U0X9_CERRI|nr:hypothetical protein KP509_09G044000 [Ceratopteris richardii]